MPSIGGMFSIARTALRAQQAAMEVAAHNIANAQTPGYTRQGLLLAAGTPVQDAFGNFGTGVSVVTVQRARDVLLDRDVRAQSAPAAGFATQRDLLGRVEGVLGEPSDTGIAAGLDAFWNAWSDLASHPTNPGARSVVQQAAVSLTNRFNSVGNELNALAVNTRSQVISEIDHANRLTAQIAALNGQIVPNESSGHTANDLRDQRDRLIDELSAIVPISVIDRTDGSNQVMLGGRPLVDGTSAKAIVLNAGAPLTLSLAGETEPLRSLGGRVGALLDVANRDIADALTSLDQLASALITDVNAIHSRGWSPPAGASGNWDPLLPPTGSGILFFDGAPANATARTITLSATIAADSNAIAVSDTLNAPGNNAIGLEIAALRDFAPSAAGNSFAGAYRVTIARIAGSARAAADSAIVAGTVIDQAHARRAATSEVSTDEELMRLMKHQQAYAAAAKIVQTIDEMTRVLIDLKA